MHLTPEVVLRFWLGTWKKKKKKKRILFENAEEEEKDFVWECGGR